MNNVFLPGYQLRLGTHSEQHVLLQFMQMTYEELYPGNDYQHLQTVIDQYWSTQTPFWLVSPLTDIQDNVGCLWLGTAIDQITGEAYTHLFLLYVCPDSRRQGMGTALLGIAEEWAMQQGDRQMGLQVFSNAQAAISLYEKFGYRPRAQFLTKSIARVPDRRPPS